MIVTWHTRALDVLFQMMEALLKDNRWYDVRAIVNDEKWSITFNDEWKVPPKLARFLEKPERDHHPTRHEPIPPRPKTVAEAKAMRKKERKR
jgi:hypothetical protein